MSNATLVRILDYLERLTLDDGIYIFKIKTLVDNLVAIEEPVAKKRPNLVTCWRSWSKL